MKKLKIGNITALRCDSFEHKPDDRQEKVETIGGVYITDMGVCDDGEEITAQVAFTKKDWETTRDYWRSRTKVDVFYCDELVGNCRVKINSYKKVQKFSNYIEATITFWRK